MFDDTTETGETPVTTEVVETEVAPVVETETPAPSADENKEDVQEQPVEPTEAEKIKSAMQKRIDRITAQKAQIQREYAEKEREYAEKLAKFEQSMPKQQDSGEPTESQFDTVEDYLIAKGKWQAKQEFAAQQAQEKAKAEQAAYAEKIAKTAQEFQAKETEFRKVTPDYDEAIQVVNEVIANVDPKSTHMAVFRDFVMESDNPTPLLYHLGKNPELIEEMQSMTPIKFAKALVRLEDKLGDIPTQQLKPTAAPPKPVKGIANTKPEDSLSGRDLLKRYKLK